MIFVFGSNLRGVHGAGAARDAAVWNGAQPGVGSGPTGSAYAIPTKREPTSDRRQLPLNEIERSVREFIEYAGQHLGETFFVTRIGCGLAGYKDEEIAPMFRESPRNCAFDEAWRPFLPGPRSWA